MKQMTTLDIPRIKLPRMPEFTNEVKHYDIGIAIMKIISTFHAGRTYMIARLRECGQSTRLIAATVGRAASSILSNRLIFNSNTK